MRELWEEELVMFPICSPLDVQGSFPSHESAGATRRQILSAMLWLRSEVKTLPFRMQKASTKRRWKSELPRFMLL